MRILLVEDHLELSHWLAKALRDAHLTVETAHNGADADALLHTQDYSLVLLDLSLPKMDGLDVLRRLRARGGTRAKTPVMILTARGGIDEKVQGLNLGADDYLAKPFELAESVAQALKGMGLTVDVLHDGVAADLALGSEEYAAVVLDVGLPRLDGFEVLARVRGRGKTLPVLMLTARGEVKDRVHGLNLGADDYLAKPFELTELEARVKALLRRSVLGGEQQQRCGALVYDLGTRRFTLGAQLLNLTSREQAVLEALIARPGRVMSKEQLADQVFGLDEDASPDAIEIYVHRLRKKLEGDAVRIVTFRGLGYLLEATGD